MNLHNNLMNLHNNLKENIYKKCSGRVEDLLVPFHLTLSNISYMPVTSTGPVLASLQGAKISN